MSDGSISVLLVEDNPGDARLVQEMLREARGGFRLAVAKRLSEGLIRLSRGGADVLLLDLGLPDSRGLNTLVAARVTSPATPIVILTGLDDEELAVEAAQAGAQDYLVKGQFDTNLLARSLRYALERKRAEEALTASEARYRSMIQQNSDGVVIVDSNGMVRFANPGAESLFRRSAVELRGTPFGFPLVVDEPVEVNIVQAGEQSGAVVAEMRVASTEWEGEIAYLASLRDITDRKRAELQLQEAERRFRTLLDNVRLVAVGLNTDGSVVYANPHFFEITGYARDEVVGKSSFGAFLPERARREKAAESMGILDGDVHPHYENAILTRDGQERLIAWNNTLLLDETGQPVGTMSIGEDITERRQAEQALQESEQLLRQVIDATPAGIFVRDRDGNFIVANDLAAEVYGTTPEQLAGASERDWSVYPTAVREEHLEDDRLVIDSKQPRIIPESAVPGPDGTTRWFYTVKVPLTARGDPDCVLGVAVDVSERVRAEQALRQAEEQLRHQERLAAVGQLAGGIAHDFNNYLTAIMLSAQLGLREPHLPPDLRRRLENTLDTTRRAATLVQQILDFSRRSLVDTELLDVGSWLERFTFVLRSTLPESIQVAVHRGKDKCVVNADPGRIQQVLMNLATNARDAMPEGGELRIGLSRAVARRGERPPLPEMNLGEWVCLSVSDTGTGMTEDVRSHLFEPFFTTKEVGRGTGLGLAQVYGIVKQHNGHIDVESKVGLGTTFRIYLPAYVEEVEQAVDEHPVPPRGRGETVLLVEDQEAIREVGQDILEGLGYRVLTAAHGQEALGVYQSAEAVDLVITDMVMPQMGGKALMRELRRRHPGQKGMIITGHALREDLQELRDAGIVETVRKPFDADTLASVVRSALDGG